MGLLRDRVDVPLPEDADEALTDLFRTVNLFDERPERWCGPVARAHAMDLTLSSVNVFLGRRVAAAFDCGGLPYFSWERMGWGGSVVGVVCLPHPSGLNRMYNDLAVRAEVASVLARTIRSAA